MRLLLDTHILMWAASGSDLLSARAREMLKSPNTERLFSTVNLWEVAIKSNLGRADFNIDVSNLRGLALHNGYQELPITIDHIVFLASLPRNHKDPFDRMLIAQAKSENLTLMTSDKTVASYGSNIVRV